MLIRAAILLLALLAASPSFSQTTFATITGTVVDAKGGVIPGVEIEVRNEATGYIYAAKTNQAGIYTAGQLVPGPHTLRARHEGFKEFVGSSIQLLSLDIKTVDIKLEVGAVNSVVEVSGAAPLIEMETGRIMQVLSARQLTTLPVLSSRLQEWLPMQPGVFVHGGAIHIGGSLNNNQNHWSMDGTQISSFRDGNQPSSVQNFLESVAEMRIGEGNATAEHDGVGQVILVSRSGTNQLHGSAVDYYSDSNWSARNPFASAATGNISHGIAGTLGGPVYIPRIYNGKNRTFFFQSYETTLGGMPRDAVNVTVPLVAWRSGDFSALSTAVRDPLTNSAFPGNRVPTARLNPVTLKLQDRFYPLPNWGDTSVLAAQNYRTVLTRQYPPIYMVTSRVDHRINDKHYAFARYTYSNRVYNNRESLPAIGQSYREITQWTWNATETWTIRPNLLNEFRYGSVFDDSPMRGPQNGLATVNWLGLQGLAPDLPDYPGLFNVSFSGLGITGISQNQYHNPYLRTLLHQFTENVTWFRGRHTIKAGINIGYGIYDDFAVPTNLYGSASFSNRFTNQPYADFLLGIPTSSSRAYPSQQVNRRRTAYDFYISDNLKLTRALTLDLGLRYQYHPFWTEINQAASMFNIDIGKIVVPDGGLKKISPFMPAGYVGIVEASSVGLDGNRILHSDRNDFAPRLGVAWRPFRSKTVFRGGFGIYYNVTPAGIPAGGVPFVIAEPGYTNPTDNPIVLPRVFPASSTGAPTTISIPKGIRGDLRTPYTLQYSATIEHEHWATAFRASYTGTGMRQGNFDANINQPLASTRLYVDNPRRFPQYPGITYTSNGSGHQYHALTLGAERRFRSGLGYNYAFVWTRDLSDTGGLENAYDRGREKGSIQEMPIRRHTLQGIYELPVGRKRHFLPNVPRVVDGIIGGWQLSTLLTTHSGMLLTPSWTGPDPTGTAYTASRTPAQVSIRPDRVADGNLPNDERTIKRWYDVSAFRAPQTGNFGTSGVSVILGPPVLAVRAAISKQFTLYERMKMILALQSTNALNHQNYSPPGMDITSLTSAGVITGIGNTSDTEQAGRRNLRLMLRVEW